MGHAVRVGQVALVAVSERGVGGARMMERDVGMFQMRGVRRPNGSACPGGQRGSESDCGSSPSRLCRISCRRGARFGAAHSFISKWGPDCAGSCAGWRSKPRVGQGSRRAESRLVPGDWLSALGFDSRPRYVSPAGLFGQRALPPQPVEIFRSSSARLTVNMSTSGENGFSRTVADSGRCICVTPSG